jgi:hypothetical protein
MDLLWLGVWLVRSNVEPEVDVNTKYILFSMHGMNIKVISKSVCHKSGERSNANLHQ